jgi:hypothetical protein
MGIFQGLVAVIFVVIAGSAHAASIKANTEFGSVKKRLVFKREGESVKLNSYSVPMRLSDPYGRGDIVKILLDPNYDPNKGGERKDDFTVLTRVRLAGSSKSLTDSALCSWRKGKKIADCSVEDDGGRYLLVVKSRGRTLARSRFKLRVGRFAGYQGFYLGRDASEEDASVMVSPRGGRPVDVQVRFD